jgi:hypothetical protein
MPRAALIALTLGFLLAVSVQADQIIFDNLTLGNTSSSPMTAPDS